MSQSEGARALRRRETPAEAALWVALRDRRIAGAKFRRSHPLGPYFADFYCAAHRLVIEVDGSQHSTPDAVEYDSARAEYMAALGLRTLRFPNRRVLRDLHGVLAEISEAVAQSPALNSKHVRGSKPRA